MDADYLASFRERQAYETDRSAPPPGFPTLPPLPLGLTTTLAVLLHEIPQELGDFGILVHSGLGVRRAVFYNAASASVAIFGTLLALWGGSVARESVANALIPITAGGFVYLASANLIPELQKDRRTRALLVQTGLISAGMAVMGLLTLVD